MDRSHKRGDHSADDYKKLLEVIPVDALNSADDRIRNHRGSDDAESPVDVPIHDDGNDDRGCIKREPIGESTLD